MDTRSTSSAKKRKLKLSDAAAFLGVSPSKVSRLIKAGELKCAGDPLDRRRKLVEVKALERLKLRSLAEE
jgi:DNA-binding MarR family transcriptional regulator